ncbi:hypothetical protein AXFE_27810 [Acidithrix ferrooxidans]|uniref:Uncharacterized protein n=1 Tax=Acidithrix ferrooxidans TaxID=1280514 RepID=A0A0D8HF19_9ACTN|nr:hypothetical protein AXFE_27810 [Acidithrix ferrooxidans]CAG4919775.1 unnamed protein product [Acidithrix sp. C25]
MLSSTAMVVEALNIMLDSALGSNRLKVHQSWINPEEYATPTKNKKHQLWR